ncbi:MAG TPA: hypothetical protein VE174_04690 [Actinomycetota bacterium]|nr:hypothetical protein [Actinomycetota bacterium]
MGISVIVGVLLALVGGGLVNLTSQLDVRRSRRPKARRYTLGFLVLCAGLAAIVWFPPCPQLSAWTIGSVFYLFFLAIPIASASWGHRIPELKWVAVALGVLIPLVISLAVARPVC